MARPQRQIAEAWSALFQTTLALYMSVINRVAYEAVIEGRFAYRPAACEGPLL